MTATAPVLAPTDIREGLPLYRQILIEWQVRLHRHARSALIVLGLLLVAGAVHAVGMAHFPHYVDDPGTYLSQAWAVQYEHRLSPYSYFYDHAPGGWVQIALWSMLTNGFGRYHSAMAFGNECMLIAKLVSTALLYALARRIGFRRVAAAAATLAFAVCPLALMYTRWTYLDNLVTPWILAAFVLARSPRRSLLAGTGAAACFGVATLTKETALVLLPAFVWAVAGNLDRRNRSQVVLLGTCVAVLVMVMYPLLALYKGELFPGPGHNSLIGTARWQLAGRVSSGSVLTSHSATAGLLHRWLGVDKLLLLGGLVAIPIGLYARRLRPVAVALAIEWLILVRGGYVPFMQVIPMLPWSALVLVGAVEVISGNSAVTARTGRTGRRTGRRAGFARPSAAALRIGLAVLLSAGLVATAAVTWAAPVHQMMTSTRREPLRDAETWLGDNVPRNKVLVVHDAIWTDMVQRYGFNPHPVMAYKLDTDPAVRRSVHRLDYLVVPNWYYATADAAQKFPTLTEARRHAVAVATFGSGADGVQVYRVSAGWRP